MSGQLETSNDLVGERARQAMSFSPPLEEQEEEGGEEAVGNGCPVTSTLEPSSPENLEPMERSEMAPTLDGRMIVRAEPENSELSTTVS